MYVHTGGNAAIFAYQNEIQKIMKNKDERNIKTEPPTPCSFVNLPIVTDWKELDAQV